MKITTKKVSKMQGMVVLITGIARGIGKAIAQQLASKGATIVGFDILENELHNLKADLEKNNTPCFLEKVDITQKEACQFFVEKVINKFSQVDIVVHSAGITHIAPSAETQMHEFDRVIQTNLLGTIYITQLCLPYIIKQKGSIVGISSVAGYSPLYYRTAYSASKYGVWGYLATLRAEMNEKNVQVLTVCPSYVDTQLQENQLKYFSNKTNEALTVDFVASKIINGIESKKRYLFIGKTAKMAYWLNKFFPSFYEAIMVKKTRN